MSETLLHEIRATKPEAPSALRERVRALSVQEPAREPFLDRIRFTWGWRRLVLAVPATVVVALVAAGAIGLSRDGDPRRAVRGRRRRRGRHELHVRAGSAERSAAAPTAAYPALRSRRRGSRSRRRRASCSASRPSSASASTTSTRSRTRPSRRSRSRATTAAASPRSQYDAPSAGVGTAQITLRIPTAAGRGRARRALPARNDRRPALRDPGPAAAGGQPADADRADAAPDRADPGRSSRARRSPTRTAPCSSHG